MTHSPTPLEAAKLFSVRLTKALLFPLALAPAAFACSGESSWNDPWADPSPYDRSDGGYDPPRDSGTYDYDAGRRDAGYRDGGYKDASYIDSGNYDADVFEEEDADVPDVSVKKDSGTKPPNSCGSFGGSCVSQAIAQSSYCETEVAADDCLPQRPHCCITSACTLSGGECLFDDGSGLIDPCTAIGGTISKQSCGLTNNICCMR